MSLEVKITMAPKSWETLLARLAAVDAMHWYNIFEAAYADAKRSKQLATIIKNKRQQKERMAGLTLPSRVDL